MAAVPPPLLAPYTAAASSAATAFVPNFCCCFYRLLHCHCHYHRPPAVDFPSRLLMLPPSLVSSPPRNALPQQCQLQEPSILTLPMPSLLLLPHCLFLPLPFSLSPLLPFTRLSLPPPIFGCHSCKAAPRAGAVSASLVVPVRLPTFVVLASTASSHGDRPFCLFAVDLLPCLLLTLPSFALSFFCRRFYLGD